MINADKAPIDIENIRLWLEGYKTMNGLSWATLGVECSVAAGTLQPFCKGKYAGDNETIARKIFKFKQMVDSRAERIQGIPVDPGYFETPTSLRLKAMLSIAHMGRMTVAGTGPGTGKTMIAREYAAMAEPVWTVTLRASQKSLPSMVFAVQRALGIDIKWATVARASQEVVNRMRGRKGLLIVDEANHLTIEGAEELRAWHDETGIGICLLGNEELIARMESGSRSHQFARINSRIAQRHVQNLPVEGDVIAFCDAWGIADPGMRKLLTDVALTPGTGGLREIRQIVEMGSMLATDEGRPLELHDLRDAKSTRATGSMVA